MSTEVERIYDELVSIKDIVAKNGLTSDASAFEATAAKSMLLAAASYFEKSLCEIIKNHAESTWKSIALVSFLDKQALERKYHTLFDWNGSNINKFIRLFGNDFFNFVSKALEEEAIKAAIKEFMSLGQLRNELAHNNYSEYPIQFTLEDIKKKFDIALPLNSFLASQLRNFEQKTSAPPS